MTEHDTQPLAGLFPLDLISEIGASVVPTINLSLLIDTPSERASGRAIVSTAGLREPNGVTSHVSGAVIFEFVMPPAESKIRIDLTGYPIVHWPPHSGVGPVILPNFKGIVLLQDDYSRGMARIEYLDPRGHWEKLAQEVVRVKTD